MKALVLAGGGAKGSYEMGVWKALRKLGMKFDIITGTSIGALNGALMVQNSYFKGMHLWLNTDFYKLFGSELQDMKTIKKMIKVSSKNLLKQDGIDVKGYEELVHKCINVDKFYKSKIDFGLVTYNLSTNKPHLLTKKSISREKLCDYLIASTSCFPILDMKVINDNNFIDGGYYDNLPINLAIDMGATNVVAIDLESIGIKRNVKNKDVDITYIKPSCDLGNFLVFDKKMIKRNIHLGYNDTLKKFKQLDGNYYSFKKNDLEKNYKKYGKDFAYVTKRIIGINTTRIYKQLNSIPIYQRLFKHSFNDKKTMDQSLELLGQIFEVPNYKIYDIKMYNHILKMKFANYEDTEELIDINSLKKLNFNKAINRKHIVKYIYTFMLNPVENYKDLSSLSVLFPKEFMGALYLYTIS